jgi:bifunctional enzyme CysN/CysC
MLDLFEEKSMPNHLPFRFPIQDVYKFDERRILAGRVESGRVKVGDKLVFSPSNKKGVIKNIEAWSVPKIPTDAEAGQSIGFSLTEQIFVERGEVASLVDEVPIVTTMFDANIFWMGKRHLEKGRKYTLKLNTQEIPCEVAEFKKVINASTLETLTDQDFLAKNDVAELTLRTHYPVVFDLFGSIATTGRFVLVDEFDVCGGGIITTYEAMNNEDRLRAEVRERDFNWVKSNIKADERAYRNGHQAVLILITGDPGVGKAKLARHLEEKLFQQNYQSYLLDRQNVGLGVMADIGSGTDALDEAARRFGEVAKLFLDAGHVVISTSNAFHQQDDSAIRLLAEPSQVLEIRVSNEERPRGNPDIMLSVSDAQKEIEAANKICEILKKKKILTGHNYSI